MFDEVPTREDDRGSPDDGRRSQGDLERVFGPLVDSIASTAEVSAESSRPSPREIVRTTLHPGGGIEALHANASADAPTTMVFEAPIPDLLERTARRRIVGIDAGLTRPLILRTPAGSQTVSVARAAAGLSFRSPPVERLRTLVGVAVDPHDRLGLDPTVETDGQTEYRVQRIGPDDSERHNNPRPLVTDYVRAISEGHLLRRVAAATDDDVALFVDGPVLPSSTVLRDFLFARRRLEAARNTAPDGPVGVRPDGGPPTTPTDDASDSEGAAASPWETLAGQVLEPYVSVAAEAIEAGTPYLGVVKEGRTDALLRSARETLPGDPDVRWELDRAVAEQLLAAGSRGRCGAEQTIKWTPWLTTDGYPDPGRDDRRVDLLRPGAGASDEHDQPVATPSPDAYRRAWFYVAVPESGAVRVETVKGLVNTPAAAERVREVALGAICRSRTGIPPAIERADKAATISRDRQRQLLRRLGVDVVTSFDRDQRRLTGGGAR